MMKRGKRRIIERRRREEIRERREQTTFFYENAERGRTEPGWAGEAKII